MITEISIELMCPMSLASLVQSIVWTSDTDYVAYYEIDTGSDYLVLSSGHKTGDFREVESGPDPRPTDVVIQQAQENGQQCETFYRLSPLGLIMCENGNGTVVAASYNWTNNDPQVGLLENNQN